MTGNPERSPGPAAKRPRLGTGGLRAFPLFREGRSLPRVSRRELEAIKMHVRAETGGTWYAARLWDFSSAGFGFTLEAPTPLRLRVGAKLIARVRLDRKQSPQAGIWIRTLVSQPDRIKVGAIRLDVDDFSSLIARPGRRPAEPSLTGRIPHPFLFRHWSPFAVIGRDSGTAFTLVSDDPCLLLFPDCEVALHLDLPELTEKPLRAKVRSLRLDAAGRMEATLTATRVPRGLRAALAGGLPL